MKTPADSAIAQLATMTVVPMDPTKFQKRYKGLWKDFERALRSDYGRGISRTLHGAIYSFSHEKGYDSFEKVESEYIANIEVALLGAESFEGHRLQDVPEVMRLLNERHKSS
jgi:hypothetical protein